MNIRKGQNGVEQERMAQITTHQLTLIKGRGEPRNYLFCLQSLNVEMDLMISLFPHWLTTESHTDSQTEIILHKLTNKCTNEGLLLFLKSECVQNWYFSKQASYWISGETGWPVWRDAYKPASTVVSENKSCHLQTPMLPKNVFMQQLAVVK